MEGNALEYDRSRGGAGVPLRKETVLLVDDEDLIRRLEKESLSMAGYTVFTASGGEEAVEIFAHRKDEIDLVVIDLTMPGMDGHTCMQELREIHPGVNILVTSGSTDDETVQSTKRAGARGFIKKPFGVREFQQTIGRVLAESRIH